MNCCSGHWWRCHTAREMLHAELAFNLVENLTNLTWYWSLIQNVFELLWINVFVAGNGETVNHILGPMSGFALLGLQHHTAPCLSKLCLKGNYRNGGGNLIRRDSNRSLVYWNAAFSLDEMSLLLHWFNVSVEISSVSTLYALKSRLFFLKINVLFLINCINESSAVW